MTGPGRRIYLRIFLLLLFVGVIAAVGFHLLTRNTHVATAELHVSPRQSLLPTRDSNHVGGHHADDFEIYAATCVELLRSRAVLSRALRTTEVNKLELIHSNEDPESFLEQALQIERPTPLIIELRLPCREEDGVECRAIVDAVAKEFVDAVQRRDMASLVERLEKLRALREGLIVKEKRERNELQTLAATLGAYEPDITVQVARNPHLSRRTESMIDALVEEIARRKVALLIDENEERQGSLDTLGRLEAEYEKQIELLTEELTARAKESRPLKSVTIEMKQRDIDRLQKEIDVMSDSIFQAQVDLESPGRIELISSASLKEL